MTTDQATPDSIDFRQGSKQLVIGFGERQFLLPYEYLRVLSPSAEVRGHQGVGGTLPYGKANVGVTKAEPSGNYGIRIYFDDGHDSGIYSYQYLLELGQQQPAYWQEYLDKLHTQGLSRQPDSQVVTLISPKGT